MPREVLLPTLHDQVTMPFALAVLPPSPDAVDGPDLYSTSIEHRAFGDVLMDTVAVLFRGTEAVRELTLTGSSVDAGFGVSFIEGFGDEVGVFEAGEFVADGEAARSEGVATVLVGLVASPSNPKPAGGGVVAGSGELSPRVDPMAAAMITTATRTPIDVRGLQPVLVEVAGAGADVAGSGGTVLGLDSDV